LGITGWYYRVLNPGKVQVGDQIRLIERLSESISVSSVWQLYNANTHREKAIEELAGVPALSKEWLKI
jgi:MOSC domain-containing protein YiiM